MAIQASLRVNGKLVSGNAPKLNPTQEDIRKLEKQLLSIEGADTSGGDFDEYRAKGLYGRLLRIPAGSVLVGHQHTQSNLNILMKGRIVTTTDEGTVELSAPQIVVGSANKKRAVHAITDCEWLTVLGTELETTQEIVSNLLVDTTKELLE